MPKNGKTIKGKYSTARWKFIGPDLECKKSLLQSAYGAYKGALAIKKVYIFEERIVGR